MTEFRWHDATKELPPEGKGMFVVMDKECFVFTATSFRKQWFRLVCAGYPYLSVENTKAWAEIPPYREASG